MSEKYKSYILSENADADIDAIFDYTESEHGFNQAVKYLSDLESVFQKLIISPEIGRKRDEVKTGLYSLPEQQHIVFYRILKNHIRIVRVLHGSKDIPKNF